MQALNCGIKNTFTPRKNMQALKWYVSVATYIGCPRHWNHWRMCMAVFQLADSGLLTCRKEVQQPAQSTKRTVIIWAISIRITVSWENPWKSHQLSSLYNHTSSDECPCSNSRQSARSRDPTWLERERGGWEDSCSKPQAPWHHGTVLHTSPSCTYLSML